MFIAIFAFVSSRGKYEHITPEGSELSTVFQVYRAGWGICTRARKTNGGPFDDYAVDGALSVLRVLPVFLLKIFYWANYSQMSPTFSLQSERMNVKVGDALMPAAILNIFDTIIILLLIPLVDRVIYPLIDFLGRPFTHLQRMGVGLVLAAGVIEIYRKQDIAATDPWFSDEINNGKTENLFFLLGSLMFLDFIVFLFVARWYEYLKPPVEAEKDMQHHVVDNEVLQSSSGDGLPISYDDRNSVQANKLINGVKV